MLIYYLNLKFQYLYLFLFIISKCIIDDDRKIENFGVFGDLAKMAVDNLTDPTFYVEAMKKAVDIVTVPFDVSIALINSNPLTQAIYKAREFIEDKTGGLDFLALIPGVAEAELIKSFYDILKSKNKCEFCRNSFKTIADTGSYSTKYVAFAKLCDKIFT